jgi:hypothetical protein
MTLYICNMAATCKDEPDCIEKVPHAKDAACDRRCLYHISKCVVATQELQVQEATVQQLGQLLYDRFTLWDDSQCFSCHNANEDGSCTIDDIPHEGYCPQAKGASLVVAQEIYEKFIAVKQ